MSITPLLEIMARLRDPVTGCPWDRQQSFASLLPFTLEEAYEVADAILRDDPDALRDELGDLLFQVVFYSQIANEQGLFDFADVVAAICDKMVRRHPHVFAGAALASADAQHQAWERIKQTERQAKARHGLLDDVALALPALMRAQKLQRRAAKVGFDWPDSTGVEARIGEELDELRQARAQDDAAAVTEELGDLLFTCVNLARHLGVDAEAALRQANAKFERRFRHMEAAVASVGGHLQQLSPERLEQHWQRAKQADDKVTGQGPA